MNAIDFPPFDLNQYRIIYMEKTQSIVKCIVKLGEESVNTARDQMIYKAHSGEITELILRLLLFEESHGRTQLALPDSFLIVHEEYALRIDTRTWTTPHRFRFFRRFADRFIGSPEFASQNHVFINHQRLDCWPFKYTITFMPRCSDIESAESATASPLQGPYDNAHSSMDHDDDTGESS